jgi:hypothetical protein
MIWYVAASKEAEHGEKTMRRTQLGLMGSVIMAVVVMAGCTDGSAAGDSAKSGGGNASTSTGATPSIAAAMDADTKAACTNISGDIDTTTTKVTEAEKIGPPAGHSAVSAQYSAGAAALYAHMFTGSAKVKDAANQVATAMSDLADTYQTAPKEAPNKAALTTAINNLKAACGAN